MHELTVACDVLSCYTQEGILEEGKLDKLVQHSRDEINEAIDDIEYLKRMICYLQRILTKNIYQNGPNRQLLKLYAYI